MTSRWNPLAAAVAAALCIAAASLGRADSGESFDAMLADCYASFRSAFWYTRTGNGDVAGFEMMAFQQSWRALRERFETAPPDAYANDADWAASLKSVADVNAAALALNGDGKAKQAHAALSAIRDILADLRKRNGVRTFSDDVNAYGAVIDAISPLRDWDRALGEADWRRMEGAADDLDAAIQVMAEQAGTGRLADPGFVRVLDDQRRALAQFRENLTNRDERGAKGSIRDIRSAYGMLFLKYG